jgi:hypothetical protein
VSRQLPEGKLFFFKKKEKGREQFFVSLLPPCVPPVLKSSDAVYSFGKPLWSRRGYGVRTASSQSSKEGIYVWRGNAGLRDKS